MKVGIRSHIFIIPSKEILNTIKKEPF